MNDTLSTELRQELPRPSGTGLDLRPAWVGLALLGAGMLLAWIAVGTSGPESSDGIRPTPVPPTFPIAQL